MLAFDRIRISGSMPVECPTNSVPGVPQDKLAMKCEVNFELFGPM
jgi:hypothetical protein